MNKTKPFSIPKQLVWEAYKQVRSNKGSAGIDEETFVKFDKNLKSNLYKIWNRMSSGSYFPPAVKGVSIPKKSGGERILGIPTISDRIAQTVVKLVLEPIIEPIFHEDSYGYRPMKSAHGAIEVTRKRCWKYPWIVEFDIKGMFDNIDHVLMMKALRKHCKVKWMLLYIKRWLNASLLYNGKLIPRCKGIPQGGVISPLLANLFLHYAFDKWCERELSKLLFCRYADDGVIHCWSKIQAEYILDKLKLRFEECRLEIHPTKSQAVYCKHGRRKEKYRTVTFTFLGYTFGPRCAQNHHGERYVNFSPAISRDAIRAINQKMRKWKLSFRSHSSLEQIALDINSAIRGWYQYYGKFYKSALRRIWLNLNDLLCRWAMRKYKKLKRHKVRAIRFLAKIANDKSNLFFHWKLGYVPTVG
jgi:RNA-directed DNA polymerase